MKKPLKERRIIQIETVEKTTKKPIQILSSTEKQDKILKEGLSMKNPDMDL